MGREERERDVPKAEGGRVSDENSAGEPKRSWDSGQIIGAAVIGAALAVMVSYSRGLSPSGLTFYHFLALVPGVVALVNYFVSVQERFELMKREMEEARTQKESDNDQMKGFKIDPGTYRPRLFGTFAGAALLSIIFEFGAVIGGHDDKLGMGTDRAVAGAAIGDGGAADAGPVLQTAGAAPATGAPLDNSHPDGGAGDGGASPDAGALPAARELTIPREPRTAPPSTVASAGAQGSNGTLFSLYGAYIVTVYFMISRLNSRSLTSRFLFNSVLRAGMALFLGYSVAATNILVGFSDHQQLAVYFCVGLFPAWALSAVRRKARDIFQQQEIGCESLPLCVVDGIDDGIADRLAELGLWDVQHLAACNPNDVIGETFYPARRVLDWVDQAILVSYVRGKIVQFRAVGIRGSIDLSVLYGDYTMRLNGEGDNEDADERKKRADTLLKAAAQKADLSPEVVLSIGRSCYEDAVVQYIWNWWFDRKVPKQGVSPASPPVAPESPPTSSPAAPPGAKP
jgi:hypothetical protein